MATYNGEIYVQQQIQSILVQLSETDELIVYDDASKDDTVGIIESFKDSRIRIFRNSKNTGVIKTFEKALTKAKGDYIFLSDQDDVWLPDKVQTCLNQLQAYNVVTSDCAIVDSDLKVLEPSFFRLMHAGPGVLKNLRKNTYQGCCMCFSKNVLKLALPFPNDIPMHDIWIGFIADLFFKVKFEPVPLLLYRRHGTTATTKDTGKSSSSLRQKIEYRINLLKYFPVLLQRFKQQGIAKQYVIPYKI